MPAPGYTQDDWARLEADLRRQTLAHGPNGQTAWTRTVWIVLQDETIVRFVTLIPEDRP